MHVCKKSRAGRPPSNKRGRTAAGNAVATNQGTRTRTSTTTATKGTAAATSKGNVKSEGNVQSNHKGKGTTATVTVTASTRVVTGKGANRTRTATRTATRTITRIGTSSDTGTRAGTGTGTDTDPRRRTSATGASTTTKRAASVAAAQPVNQPASGGTGTSASTLQPDEPALPRATRTIGTGTGTGKGRSTDTATTATSANQPASDGTGTGMGKGCTGARSNAHSSSNRFGPSTSTNTMSDDDDQDDTTYRPPNGHSGVNDPAVDDELVDTLAQRLLNVVVNGMVLINNEHRGSVEGRTLRAALVYASTRKELLAAYPQIMSHDAYERGGADASDLFSRNCRLKQVQYSRSVSSDVTVEKAIKFIWADPQAVQISWGAKYVEVDKQYIALPKVIRRKLPSQMWIDYSSAAWTNDGHPKLGIALHGWHDTCWAGNIELVTLS